MFKKILIVNRGEIAVRIIRACKELNIISATIFSDADKNALHVRFADEAYYIGGSLPNESYLNIPKIIEIAKKINADAIHPGYGFLSENPTFIKEVEDKGIIFIGPSSTSVRMMGNKTSARELMKKNNVSIVPGTTTPIHDIFEGKKIASEIGFPVLIKASAGGGGKGMKKVNSVDEFESAFSSAQREAKKAFNDDSVYIEKLIENPKHIEVQIIADKHGNYCHLFERDCSVQRRHQKVIEEAPSVFIDDITRKKITDSSINAAKACSYYNAGTIEFLMDSNKNFFFLEMNTRLQVEHPVTELITGIDLVKEQISIAQGNKLTFTQDDIKIRGHAIECRIYAEDANNNFLPAIGQINYHRLPSGSNVRVDKGIDIGSEVTVFYDPLLSKLSVLERDRNLAIKKMELALNEYLIAGIQTNIPFLKWVLKQEKFINGSFNINFLEKEFIPLIPDKWKEDRNDEEDVASIFAVLLKNQFKVPNENNLKKSIVVFENKWTDLIYE